MKLELRRNLIPWNLSPTNTLGCPIRQLGLKHVVFMNTKHIIVRKKIMV
ncbi:38572_t:CDS:2 [Gigaspora margarita]|uniref:38572_t:CDS:1 n=1 Tax=Gigaspora margarita TaxID=4874 RepID=A0ABM8W6E5_GIGMA|nr:38572_t:CDS:2 [Gigaspora margarita]